MGSAIVSDVDSDNLIVIGSSESRGVLESGHSLIVTRAAEAPDRSYWLIGQPSAPVRAAFSANLRVGRHGYTAVTDTGVTVYRYGSYSYRYGSYSCSHSPCGMVCH